MSSEKDFGRQDKHEGACLPSADSAAHTSESLRRCLAVSLSKRLRFEIFKRDKFQCAYCGRQPPTVVLHVDHIIPRSEGGTDDPCNLATSCFECNIGKSNIQLSCITLKQEENIEDRKERFDQLSALAELQMEIQDKLEEWFALASDKWISLQGNDPNQTEISGDLAAAVRRFLKRLPVSEVLDSMEIAHSNLGRVSEHSTFKYFCGVCWRKIRPETNPLAQK